MYVVHDYSTHRGHPLRIVGRYTLCALLTRTFVGRRQHCLYLRPRLLRRSTPTSCTSNPFRVGCLRSHNNPCCTTPAIPKAHRQTEPGCAEITEEEGTSARKRPLYLESNMTLKKAHAQEVLQHTCTRPSRIYLIYFAQELSE